MNPDALEYKDPLVSPDKKVFQDSPDPEELMGYLDLLVGLEDLELRVCPGLLVWTD